MWMVFQVLFDTQSYNEATNKRSLFWCVSCELLPHQTPSTNLIPKEYLEAVQAKISGWRQAADQRLLHGSHLLSWRTSMHSDFILCTDSWKQCPISHLWKYFDDNNDDAYDGSVTLITVSRNSISSGLQGGKCRRFDLNNFPWISKLDQSWPWSVCGTSLLLLTIGQLSWWNWYSDCRNWSHSSLTGYNDKWSPILYHP